MVAPGAMPDDIACVPRRGLKIRACRLLFLLSLFEVNHRDMIRFGKAADCLHIRIADFAKRG